MMEWLREHALIMEVLGVVSALFFVATLVAVPVIVARIPEDYFVRDTSSPRTYRNRHPVLKLLIAVGKNVLGAVVLGVGVLLLILPGQGLLTILLGLLLIDFPGKRRLELALIRRPKILQTVNWMRHRAGRPALQVK